jgi:hypothetical protein
MARLPAIPPAADTVAPTGILWVVSPESTSMQITIPGCPTPAEPNVQI